MILDTLTYVPAIVGVFIVGLFVFLKSKLEKKFFYFSLVSFNIAGLLLFQYLSSVLSDTGALLSLRSAVAVGSFLGLFFLLFAESFSNKVIINRALTRFTVVLVPIIFVFLSYTDLLIVNFDPSEGQSGIEYGPLYLLQTISIISYVAGAFYLLISGLKDRTERVRVQTRYLLYAVGIALVGNLLSGLILASYRYAEPIGPLSLFIMTAMIAYTIVRHGLFDIRAAIARSLTYLLSLGSITGAIVLLIFVLSSAVAESNLPLIIQRSAYVILTITLVLTYPRLKAFFDRVTNKFFYRDAYDSEVLLNELNAILVTTIDLSNLLRGSATVLDRNIKAEYSTFVLKGVKGSQARFFGSKEDFNQSDIDKIRKSSGSMRRKIIVTSELGEEHQELAHALQEKSIAILAGMVTHSEKIGYLILGDKKSGNIYSKQDIRIIDLIVDELALATQNSLRFEEIQNFANTLQDKVTDATKELRKTNEKLKALDEAKDEFISMASHQLRTPLTSVKGYLSMVLEGDTGPLKKPQMELLEQAFTSSQRMVYLIADLLNVSRLRTGKFVIENKETYLPDVVEGEVNQLRESAVGRKLTLNYEKPKQFPRLLLDETKVRQVVMNFLDNAIYYTPAGGKIDVKLEVTPESVSYTVDDNGVGVPKSERHHLFNKFYRAGNAKKMRPDGTGLGLFMAKKVIVAQGGAIIFKTEEGKGSTFGFSFPRAKCEVKSK